ncbi:MAG: ATP-binding protein [Planctomycetaceae bacterium]
MRRHELRSTMMTSNRPLEDWGELIGDVPAATAILDRFLENAEVIQLPVAASDCEVIRPIRMKVCLWNSLRKVTQNQPLSKTGQTRTPGQAEKNTRKPNK